jgi:hypothetical protein
MRFILLLVSMTLMISEPIQAKGKPDLPAPLPFAPDHSITDGVRKLEMTSNMRTLMTFGATGRVSALAGSFPLANIEAPSVILWLNDHRDLLGLGQEDQLLLTKSTGEKAQRRSREGAKVIHVFDVTWKKRTFSGMQIVTIVDPSKVALVGLLSTVARPLDPKWPTKAISVESAWKIAESRFGMTVERQQAEQVWFDVSWAIQRIPGTPEMHWRLLALDPGGGTVFAFVRAKDGAISYATPLKTHFNVPQTHKSAAGVVLWDNQTLPNGCRPNSPGCDGIALSESLLSRDIIPKTVDLWHFLSQPGSFPPFVWPFSGPNRAPFDNQGGRRIGVIVASPLMVGRNIADFPSRDGLTSTYRFPEGTVTSGYVGHEYGHVLLGTLKAGIHPGNASREPYSSPAAFTEAMADLIGMVTTHTLKSGVPMPPTVGGWTTDFSIGDFTYSTNGSVVAPPPVAWDMRSGNCSGEGRARIGRAFLNAWGANLQQFGARPATTGRQTYRGWWIDILRSFALLPDFSFPTNKEFYDATVSRGYAADTPRERLPTMFLKLEMEKLGLDSTYCL